MHLYYFTENKNLGGGYIPHTPLLHDGRAKRVGDTSPIPPVTRWASEASPSCHPFGDTYPPVTRWASLQ